MPLLLPLWMVVRVVVVVAEAVAVDPVADDVIVL